MKKKYGTLRFISALYLILSVFVFFIALAGGVFVLTSPNGGAMTNVATAISVVVSGILVATGLLAVSEFISLIIDMEESARITAVSMQRLVKGLSDNLETRVRKHQSNEIEDPVF